MKKYKEHETFLFKNSGYIVYFVFIIGIFLNGGLSIHYFINGFWYFGIWAILSIMILPKAVFGLILLLGEKSIVSMNMPMILRGIFPKTMHRYGSLSLVSSFGHPVLRGFIREIIWLGIGLFPVIIFFFL